MAKSTVETETILDRLVEGKREELASRQSTQPLAAVRAAALAAPRPPCFVQALRGACVRVIAEVKRASPTAGVLDAGVDAGARALSYAREGAAAISVLTEQRQFMGSLNDLRQAAGALSSLPEDRRPPLLRKDFLFDPYHLYEAQAAGAAAVLLIVAMLEQAALIDLLALAQALGLAVNVEVHDEAQTERALAAKAAVIGINNRDLRTFVTNLAVSERLRPLIPEGTIVISESGIRHKQDVERLAKLGIDAVLVGEALMRSGDLASGMRDLGSVPRGAGLVR